MSRSRNRRVVITGLGCVSPIGNTIADAWSAALAGKSGIANITKFDASSFSTHFAGEVKGFNVEEYMEANGTSISKASFHNAMKELLAKKFIAESVEPHKFWINPHLFFNGDRMSFVREYRLKSEKELRASTKRISEEVNLE